MEKGLVENVDGKLVVSSRDVAENFKKRHGHVMRDIENIKIGSPQNWGVYFIPNTYVNNQNKQTYPEYLLTRDGFSLLVMGFTGKKAAQFKLLYIRAFNWMMEQLHENRDLQHLLHDFTRREAVSVANGTLHGQGLARRRIEKHALSHEQAVIHAKLQLCLNLIGEEAA